MAADALGRAPPSATLASHPVEGTPSRVGLLLEAMAHDRYPAVRHLAARALGRVLAVDHPQAAAAAARFDATGDVVARALALQAIGQALPGPTPPLAAARLALLRGEATRADIDIGE